MTSDGASKQFPLNWHVFSAPSDLRARGKEKEYDVIQHADWIRNAISPCLALVQRTKAGVPPGDRLEYLRLGCLVKPLSDRPALSKRVDADFEELKESLRRHRRVLTEPLRGDPESFLLTYLHLSETRLPTSEEHWHVTEEGLCITHWGLKEGRRFLDWSDQLFDEMRAKVRERVGAAAIAATPDAKGEVGGETLLNRMLTLPRTAPKGDPAVPSAGRGRTWVIVSAVLLVGLLVGVLAGWMVGRRGRGPEPLRELPRLEFVESGSGGVDLVWPEHGEFRSIVVKSAEGGTILWTSTGDLAERPVDGRQRIPVDPIPEGNYLVEVCRPDGTRLISPPNAWPTRPEGPPPPDPEPDHKASAGEGPGDPPDPTLPRVPDSLLTSPSEDTPPSPARKSDESKGVSR